MRFLYVHVVYFRKFKISVVAIIYYTIKSKKIFSLNLYSNRPQTTFAIILNFVRIKNYT